MVLSNILTNIRTIPTKKREGSLWANATWKKNTIMINQSTNNFHAKRLVRMENAPGYANTNISNPYIRPNPNALDLKLVKENNVYDYVMDFRAKELEARRFNYYDPVAQGPKPRGTPYSVGGNYAIALV
jgi:hypothetical protein